MFVFDLFFWSTFATFSDVRDTAFIARTTMVDTKDLNCHRFGGDNFCLRRLCRGSVTTDAVCLPIAGSSRRQSWRVFALDNVGLPSRLFENVMLNDCGVMLRL